MNAPSINRYAFSTHCTPVDPAENTAWMDGSARFTTVPSMNARLEPRIAATSTHGLSRAGHGTRRCVARARFPASTSIVSAYDIGASGNGVMQAGHACPAPGRHYTTGNTDEGEHHATRYLRAS